MSQLVVVIVVLRFAEVDVVAGLGAAVEVVGKDVVACMTDRNDGAEERAFRNADWVAVVVVLMVAKIHYWAVSWRRITRVVLQNIASAT